MTAPSPQFQTVASMSAKGSSIPEIVKATGLRYCQVANLRFRARNEGLLEPVPLGVFPVAIGSLGHEISKLDKDHRDKLTKIIPSGLTVSEFCLALINDVIDEEYPDI